MHFRYLGERLIIWKDLISRVDVLCVTRMLSSAAVHPDWQSLDDIDVPLRQHSPSVLTTLRNKCRERTQRVTTSGSQISGHVVTLSVTCCATPPKTTQKCYFPCGTVHTQIRKRREGLMAKESTF